MQSPCRSCAHQARDKNHPGCLACPQRVAVSDGTVRMEATVEKTEGGTQICTDIKCPSNGKPQPMKNFQKSATAKSGRLSVCRACMRRKMADGHAKKKAMKQAEVDLGKLRHEADKATGGNGTGSKPVERKANPINYQAIEIDFQDHPHVLQSLKKMAVDELRTLENQIIYVLMCAAKGSPYCKFVKGQMGLTRSND